MVRLVVVDADRVVDVRLLEVGESPPPPGLLVEAEHGPSAMARGALVRGGLLPPRHVVEVERGPSASGWRAPDLGGGGRPGRIVGGERGLPAQGGFAPTLSRWQEPGPVADEHGPAVGETGAPSLGRWRRWEPPSDDPTARFGEGGRARNLPTGPAQVALAPPADPTPMVPGGAGTPSRGRLARAGG